MPSDEQDACNICDGDRSTTKNPIIFCDGKGCNMPVHKLCYNVQEIPEDDWYCQRCENKKRKKATNIICCPMQTGAVKKTTVAGEYMHVVCAMWNKSINNQIEPYVVSKSLLDKEACHYCTQKKGLVMRCEEPNCNIRFHATCAINNSLIVPAPTVPANFSAKCSQHQTVYYNKKTTKGKRRLRRNDDSDDDEDEEDSEEEDDESDESEDDVEEEDDEDDDSEDERRKDKRKKPLMINSNSNKGKPPAAAPVTPMKRRASPQSSLQSLFPEDQQSSDDDDDMGTSSTKSKLNTFNNSKPTTTTTTTTTTLAISSNNHAVIPPSASSTPSYKERLEAKRKKSALESRPGMSLPDDRKPLSITPPLAAASTSFAVGPTSSSSTVTQKQKLPNRAHLTNNNNINSVRPGNTPPATIKRYNNGPGIIKDIDEIHNEIKAQQRWSNAGQSGTTLQHPQPTTPHTIPTSSFFENEIARNNNNNTGQRKSMDGWKPMNGGEKEELLRMREENRKLTEFKRAVSEVLSGLNVPVATGIIPDVEHVEIYVAQLQSLLRRVGPIREQERIQIQECVKGLSNNNMNNGNNQ